jgi:aromatic ring-opening dioxygenase catalytic subunit (LigB family)
MSVVAAFCVSHGPGLLAWPQAPGPEQSEPILVAFAEAGRRLSAVDPDVVVIITSEHFANFFDVRPSMYINVGERASGPEEAWLGVPKRDVPGHPELALAMLVHSLDGGFDPAHGHDLVLDHSSIVPIELMRIPPDLPVVPIIVNGLVWPMAPVERFAAWGDHLHPMLERRPERIAVIGAGGLSHWPGMPEQGKHSPEWDRAVLDAMEAGGREALRAMPTPGLADAGPGAEEIRAWACAYHASGARPAETIAYDGVPAWAGGIAVVDLLDAGRANTSRTG